MSGKLFLVGTPIGNLSDMSPRAVDALTNCDFIAAEDTRVTMKLLSHFDIKKPLVSYYEHNKYSSGEKILSRLISGETCALVTDAGMPAISDPGEDIVRLCVQNGVAVEVIPGPTAFVTALALSGMSSSRFCFEGFLSVSKKSRMAHLKELQTERRTMIFYEAPHKLLNTLTDLQKALGDRQISISRELTKLHEETLRTTISGAIAHFTENQPRGEFVLIVAGAQIDDSEPQMTLEQALAVLDDYREKGHSLSDAAKRAAADTGFSKNELYNAAIGR